MVFTKELEFGQLLKLYYLMLQKKYLEEKNICKTFFAIQYLRKMLNIFYKKYPDKPIATFLFINTTLLMIKAIINLKN